jgi:cyclohexa-1,5-dienecarbonyl-CoA hydratase
MAGETAILETIGDTARVTIRRPPVNFLNLELLMQLESHLDAVRSLSECRCLLLEAEGAAFSAGLEVSEQTPDGVFLLIEQFHRVALALVSLPRLTVALVRGMALGAGNELAACCDWVLASDKASFGQPEIKMGLIPSLAPVVLPAVIGQRRAVQMMLTGSLISGKAAEELGLVNRVLPDDQLAAGTEDLLKTLRGYSVSVLEVAVQALRLSKSRDLHERLRELESLYLNHLMELQDPAEGVKAFLEKRAPKWRNA